MDVKAKYEIKIVPDSEFDKLPYKRARESFGLADAERGVAFIRQTGVRGVDLNTINHEFDELLQKVSPHEEDGIRYKGGFFKKVFRPILSIASLIPSPIQPFALAANTGLTIHDIGDRGFRPLDLLSLAPTGLGAFKGAAAAAPGALSRLGGAAKGAFGFAGAGANAAGSKLSNTALSSKDLAKDPWYNFAPEVRQLAGKASTTPDFASGFASGIKNLAPAAQGTSSTLSRSLPAYLPQAATGLAGGLSKALDTFKSGAAETTKNLATKAIASQLAPKQSAPLQNVGPATFSGQANPGAFDRFGSFLKQSPTEETKYISDDDVLEAFKGIDINSAFRTRQAQQQFRGQSREGNTSFNSLLNNIAQSRDLEKNQFTAEANAENQNRYKAAVKADLMKINNLTESQFNDYLKQAQSPNASGNLKKVFADFL